MPFPVPHVGGYYDTSCSIHLAAPERMCYFLQLPSPAGQPISCSVPSRVPGYTGNYSCSVLCRVPGYTFSRNFRSVKGFYKKNIKFRSGKLPKKQKTAARGRSDGANVLLFATAGKCSSCVWAVLPDWSQLVSFCVYALSVSVLFFTLSSSLPVHINRGKHDKHIRKLEYTSGYNFLRTKMPCE